ncbi:TRAP transporter substrate-binding protein [Peptoniphilus sp. MSJ-1]|uniref:TRAP transporter substrate-binding protein n=1 Tax=Peptoniphilus ovalis TaxID=2841503 RepID=A0ABS6FGI5_9FIRM|nr:TRAP transporter substrate-binding protein [Peptoniphilus ovalis]MBU5668642.1 TRAP transporter substrate-binding protein [Peptoniphilus ovalis]
MRKFLNLILMLILSFTLLGCSEKDNNKKVFQIGFTTAPVEDDPYYIFAKTFSDIVKEKTNGEIIIDVKGSGQLGQEGEMFTGMQIGTTDMAIMTNAYISGYIPQAGLFDLPFIFKNGEEAARVLDGKVGKEILKGYEDYGIEGLAYGEGGFRHLVTVKNEVKKPEDFHGLKIRCMETDTYIATYQELGTNAVPMAWSETITGLQQGTIDGLDIPVSVIYTNGFADIAKYVNMTGHFYSPLILCVSKTIYEELDSNEQEILREAAIEAGKTTRISNAKSEPVMLEEMEAQGMNIVQDVDKEAFQKAFEDFYDKRAEGIGKKYLEELRKELGL